MKKLCSVKKYHTPLKPKVKYGNGGWLDEEKVGGIGSTLLGAAGTAIGGPVGGMVGSSLGGLIGKNLLDMNGENEMADIYKAPVSKTSQLYQHAYGGPIDNVTEYNGAQHEQGGMPFDDYEVEGGESRTGDMIHSDKIVITKDMIKYYPFLKRSDVGRTPSDIVKSKMKKFEKRKGDAWNDEAFNATKAPYEQMSADLSQMFNSTQQMAFGGDISEGDPIPVKKDSIQIQAKGPVINPVSKEAMKRDYDLSNYNSITKRSGYFQSHKYAVNGSTAGNTGHKGTYMEMRRPDGGFEYYSIPEFTELFKADEKKYPLLRKGGPVPKAKTGLDLTALLDDGGNAPLIANGIGMVKSMLTPTEKVNYDQVPFTPTEVTPMSAQSGINRIERVFGNVKGQTKRLNPSGYLARMNDIGSREAEAISDYSGKVAMQNNETINRAKIYDSQSKMRTNMTNAQIGMQEAEANAANRGAKRTATDAYLMNMGTQIGQKSRDDKMYDMQEKYQASMIDLQQQYIDILKDPNKTSAQELQAPDSMKRLSFPRAEYPNELNTNSSFNGSYIDLLNGGFDDGFDPSKNDPNKKRKGGYVPLARRLITKSKF